MLKKLCIAAGALVLAAVLAVLIWALLPARQIPSALESLDTSMEDVRDWDKVIAYVPLDDRTDNMEDVVYLAEASGYQLVLPDGDIYCTKLDGQEPNSNGTQYGDREALMAWVRELCPDCGQYWETNRAATCSCCPWTSCSPADW